MKRKTPPAILKPNNESPLPLSDQVGPTHWYSAMRTSKAMAPARRGNMSKQLSHHILGYTSALRVEVG